MSWLEDKFKLYDTTHKISIYNTYQSSKSSAFFSIKGLLLESLKYKDKIKRNFIEKSSILEISTKYRRF